MLLQLTPELGEKLKEHFPDIFREIRTIFLLRLVDSVTSAKMIQPLFLDSYMSDVCGDIAVSEGSVRRFISKLGSMQDHLNAFMKTHVMPGTTLLFDGTTIFTRFADSLAVKGYNPEHSCNPQARILYVFEKDTYRPVFYHVVQGSVVDKTAFMDVVHASGCRDCIIIADKGFYSKKNVSALLSAGMKYILPLQDNTVNVETEFYENTDDNKWDGVFSFNKRAVWFRKNQVAAKEISSTHSGMIHVRLNLSDITSNRLTKTIARKNGSLTTSLKRSGWETSPSAATLISRQKKSI